MKLRVDFVQWIDAVDGPASGDEYGGVDTSHVPRIGELVSLRYSGEDPEWSPETLAATAGGYLRGRVQDVQYHVHPGRGQHGGSIDATVFLVPVKRS